MPSTVHATATAPGTPGAGDALSVALGAAAGRTEALGLEAERTGGCDADDPVAACEATPADPTAPHAAGDTRITARTTERTTCNGW